jgi:DHA2 family multidrug resistance protein
MLSRLDLQVSMGGVVPANLLMGFSMGFIFVPLTTMTLGGLSREQIGAGTGLQNLMRNLGGAMGISYVTTMLVRFAQAHQGFMAAHLSSLNPSYQKQLGTLQKAFAPSFSPVDALHRAQGSIYNIVLLQANYWAYMNIFYVMIWVSAVCVLGAIMFKKVKTAGPVVMH